MSYSRVSNWTNQTSWSTTNQPIIEEVNDLKLRVPNWTNGRPLRHSEWFALQTTGYK